MILISDKVKAMQSKMGAQPDFLTQRLLLYRYSEWMIVLTTKRYTLWELIIAYNVMSSKTLCKVLWLTLSVLSPFFRTGCQRVNSFFSCAIYLVYDLKFVGALKIEFVAPIPEQTGTPTMHFSNVSGGPYQKLPAQKLGEVGYFWVFEYRVQTDWSTVNNGV